MPALKGICIVLDAYQSLEILINTEDVEILDPRFGRLP